MTGGLDTQREPSASGFQTGIGASGAQGEATREEARKAADGNEDSFALVSAALLPSAWAIANALTPDAAKAEAIAARGILTLLDQVRFDRGEPDLGIEIVRSTRESVHAAALGPRRRWFRRSRTRAPIFIADPTAATALRRLRVDQRISLWLTEAQHLTHATVARVLGTTTKDIAEDARQARLDFYWAYVEASPTPDDDPACASVRAAVPDYLANRLNAVEATDFEQRLSTCSQCRALVDRLQALEGRLRDAVPVLPQRLLASLDEQWKASFGIIDLRVAPFGPVMLTPALPDLPADDERSVLAAFAPLPEARTTTWWLKARRRTGMTAAGVAATVLIVGAGAAVGTVQSATADRPASDDATPQPGIPAPAVETAVPTPTVAAPVATTTSTTRAVATTTTSAVPTTRRPIAAPTTAPPRTAAPTTTPTTRPSLKDLPSSTVVPTVPASPTTTRTP